MAAGVAARQAEVVSGAHRAHSHAHASVGGGRRAPAAFRPVTVVRSMSKSTQSAGGAPKKAAAPEDAPTERPGKSDGGEGDAKPAVSKSESAR